MTSRSTVHSYIHVNFLRRYHILASLRTYLRIIFEDRYESTSAGRATYSSTKVLSYFLLPEVLSYNNNALYIYTEVFYLSISGSMKSMSRAVISDS